MKQYRGRTFENLKLKPNVEYVNQCGEFGDLVLEKIKFGISQKMNVELSEIEIGQEDWGWYLEFQKNGIYYELDISYQGKDAEGAPNFGATVEAAQLEKGFFFDRKIKAHAECEQFAEAIKNTAKENQIEVFAE